MQSQLYRLFATLLHYPRPALFTEVDKCQALLQENYPEAAALLAEFLGLIKETSVEVWEEIYTSTFDVNPVCFPYPGFHLFGENFNRADFLVKLQQKYQDHGFVYPTNELADHLSIMLEFLSTLDTEEVLARELREDCLLESLEKMVSGFPKDNPYLLVVRALQSFLKSLSSETLNSYELSLK